MSAANSCSRWLPNQPASVAGNKMMRDAKIGGITPAHVQLQRQMRALPTVDLAPNLTLGIVHQDLSLPALDKHHERRHQNAADNNNNTSGIENAPVRASSRVPPIARGNPAAIPAKMISGNTVADTALGNLLTQPHQEHGPGHQSNHRGQPEQPGPDRSPARAATQARWQCPCPGTVASTNVP